MKVRPKLNLSKRNPKRMFEKAKRLANDILKGRHPFDCEG